ncbi:MAG: DNA (cytosine-5-)-methyltransferase [Chloroflexi bacterium]|nr:DNA (cytosine-5-)-methyltransferase [Chloroflexota bacterium]
MLQLFPIPTARAPGSFTFIDLFAGIGGMRIGLTRVGGRCVYSCEIDRFARRTYEANFGPCEGHDIREVDPDSIPDHDVLAAGFPCQPFSIAGVSKKLSLGRQHGFADEKSGNLFFEIVRVLEAKRPSVVFLENVKNLRTHDRGRTMQVILSELDRLGYEMAVDVVDARHWVPQHRERTFLIGFRRSVYGGRRFEFPPIERRVPAPRLRDVLEPWWERRYVLTEHLWSYLQGYRDKHRERGNGFGYGLFGGDDVARTLSARYHKDGSEILIDTGSRLPRRLTPTECGALMGFPAPRVDRDRASLEADPAEPIDSFVIPVSDTQAYRQFGNAVVVDVIEHLGGALVAQAGFGRAPVAEVLAAGA